MKNEEDSRKPKFIQFLVQIFSNIIFKKVNSLSQQRDRKTSVIFFILISTCDLCFRVVLSKTANKIIFHLSKNMLNCVHRMDNLIKVRTL